MNAAGCGAVPQPCIGYVAGQYWQLGGPMGRLLGIAALMLAGAAPVTAKPTEGAVKAFIEALYLPYRAPPTEVVDVLKRPEHYFDAGLVAAMKADNTAAAGRGEVPLLDGDPICDCQDYLPFQPQIGPVTISGQRAEVVVRFNNGSERNLTYTLDDTKDGWRIYDIRSDNDSLRGLYKL